MCFTCDSISPPYIVEEKLEITVRFIVKLFTPINLTLVAQKHNRWGFFKKNN